jgi:hypothetical protein
VATRYFSSFSNSPPTTDGSRCQSTQFTYTPNSGSGDDGTATNSEARVTYRNRDVNYSRQFLVRRPGERIEIQSQKVVVAWNDSGNLFTTNRYHTNGAFSGYLKSIRHADGTATAYFYETNSMQKITIILNGQVDPASDTNIVNGTKTVTVVGLAGQTLSNVVYAIPETNVVLSQEVYGDFDDIFRARRVSYLDGTFKQVSYDCCGVAYEIDRDGTRTDYTYAISSASSLSRATASARFTLTMARAASYPQPGREPTVPPSYWKARVTTRRAD